MTKKNITYFFNNAFVPNSLPAEQIFLASILRLEICKIEHIIFSKDFRTKTSDQTERNFLQRFCV